MSEIVVATLVAAVGVALGWLVRGQKSAASVETKAALLAQAQQQLADVQRQLEAERIAGQSALVANAALQARLDAELDKVSALVDFEKNAKESFESLAANALDANSKRLAAQYKAELESQQKSATSDLASKETSIKNMLEPMQKSLEKLAEHSQQLEVQREGAYKAILTEVENIQRSHLDLRRETTQLVQALRAPKVRGNWGEMQLRRCVEHAGMVKHASFDVEKFVKGEDASVRPDLVVFLPNQRCIVIDAKTPLDAFLNAGACEDEVVRQGFMREHAAAVRKHLDLLSSKAYWNYFKESPDFVVCFLPSEVLFSAALEQDPALLEHSAKTKVLLSTPTTLIALLKAVAYGWTQEQTARDAQLINDIANKIHSKLVGMHESFVSLGSSLKSAGKHYDTAIGQAEGKGGVFSIARELRELSIGKDDIGELKPIAIMPRSMQHQDWGAELAIAANADAEARPNTDIEQ